MEYGMYIGILSIIFIFGGGLALYFYLSEREVVALIAIIIVAIMVFLARNSMYKSTATQEEFTVTKQERIVDRDGKGSRYLIFTPGETYQNTDAFWTFRKTNSSDLYGEIVPGHRYSCKVVGWRIHFTSSYRNIIDCTEVK